MVTLTIRRGGYGYVIPLALGVALRDGDPDYLTRTLTLIGDGHPRAGAKTSKLQGILGVIH